MTECFKEFIGIMIIVQLAEIVCKMEVTSYVRDDNHMYYLRGRSN